MFSPILEYGFPGCRIDRVSELEGGVSARAVVVDLVLAGSTFRRVVVRRPRRGTAEATRGALRAEFALLGWCRRVGVPAPQPYFVDERRGAIVLEYIEGEVELSFSGLESRISQMAEQLARLHQFPVGSELSFLESRSTSAERDIHESPLALDASLNEAELRSRLRRLWPWAQHNPEVLLHGDYWPGNLLWREGKLVAVLDWEEPAVGDPLADLAIARLDVLWAFGEAAMQRLTECYRAVSRIEWSQLPHWDLWAALRPMSRLARWAPAYATPHLSRPDVTELSMRQGHRRFVEQALANLR
ncbi:MAG TPA: phosphotransferase [Polyangiaceae bacterium]